MTTATQPSTQGLRIEEAVDIQAPAETVWKALLHALGPGWTGEKGEPMHMKLEAWPGGRLYRDLGHNAGHLWGHVQVVKPPRLLEIAGPLFMSCAAINHLQCRLTESAGAAKGGTRLALIHRAIGEIPPGLQEDCAQGWKWMLDNIRGAAEKH